MNTNYFMMINKESVDVLKKFYQEDLWIMEADKGEKIKPFTKAEVIDTVRNFFNTAYDLQLTTAFTVEQALIKLITKSISILPLKLRRRLQFQLMNYEKKQKILLWEIINDYFQWKLMVKK